MADWKSALAVAVKALLGLAILVAAVCSVLALVTALALKKRLDPIDDPTVVAGGLREGMVLPGRSYFIYVPAAGVVTQVKPCDTNPPEAACVPFNYNKFVPATAGTQYTSAYTAVRFVRDNGSQAGSGNPLKYGDRVLVFFVQQGMWFTGKDRMVSAARSDALSVPLSRPVWTQDGASYAAPDPDGYVTTSSLVFFDAQADGSGSVPTHRALVGADYPAVIGEFVP